MLPFWPQKPKSIKSPPVPTDEEIISSAPIRMHPYQNIAPGTWGYAVVRLANEGKLTCRMEYGVLPQDTVYIYEASK